MKSPHIILALLLWSIAAPAAAQGVSTSSGAGMPSAEVERRLEAAEARYEALDDRQIATAAKLEAAESAYSRFETVTGLVGLLITLVVAAFGIFTHRAAVNAAKTEIADLKKQLSASIQEAATEAKQQRAEFERQKAEISKLFDEAREAAAQVAIHRDTAKATAEEVAQLLANAQSVRAKPGEPMVELSEADRGKVQAAAKDIQDKPESDWSFEDYKARIAAAGLVDADWREVLRLAQALAVASPDDPEAVAFALFQKAYAHGQLGDSESEIETYDELIQRYGGSDTLAIQEPTAKAVSNKGVALGELGRHDEAFAVFDEMVCRYSGSDEPVLQVQTAVAIYNRSVALRMLGRLEQAVDDSDEVERRYGGSDMPDLQEQVAKALVNKSFILGQLDRTEEAIGVSDEVVRRFGGSDAPVLREQTAWALFNKASFLAKLKRVTAVIAALEKWAAHRGGVDCKEVADEALFDAIRERPRFKAFLKKHGCA